MKFTKVDSDSAIMDSEVSFAPFAWVPSAGTPFALSLGMFDPATSPAFVTIFSDLHIAAQTGEGLFQSDAALVECLGWIQRERPGEVVLAGDIFDFLFPPKGEAHLGAFEPHRAAGWVAKIEEAHPEVFAALRTLNSSAQHAVVLMGGNHDPELALPPVQVAIEQAIGSVLWRVRGEAYPITLGDARCIVLHGDVFDPWNWIRHDALGKAIRRSSRGIPLDGAYRQPPGTTLATGPIDRMRQRYPWVLGLKPEREGLLPLLAWVADHDELEDLRTIWLTFLELARHSGVRTLYQHIKGEPVHLKLAARRSSKKLMQRLLRGHKPLEELIERLRQAAANTVVFDLETPDMGACDVGWLIDQGNDLVVAGHTHAAKAHLVQGKKGRRGLYVNSGTWMPIVGLPGPTAPQDEWLGFVEAAMTNALAAKPRPTLVEIDHAAQSVSLLGWPHEIVARFEWRDGHWQEST